MLLQNSRITDAGIAHLRGLTGLEVLNIVNTKITDAGLVHLEGLTGLRVLHLQLAPITDAGVTKLKTALPNCKIRIDNRGRREYRGPPKEPPAGFDPSNEDFRKDLEKGLRQIREQMPSAGEGAADSDPVPAADGSEG